MKQIERDKDRLEALQGHCLDLTKAILKALRLGLDDHPVILEWLEITHCAHEGRKILRRAKKGLEKGAKRVISKAELELTAEISRLRQQGESISNIFRILTHQGRIPLKTRTDRMILTSRSGLERWYSRQGLREP